MRQARAAHRGQESATSHLQADRSNARASKLSAIGMTDRGTVWRPLPSAAAVELPPAVAAEEPVASSDWSAPATEVGPGKLGEPAYHHVSA